MIAAIFAALDALLPWI